MLKGEKMNIIKNPLLPEKSVKVVLCDSRVEGTVIKEINKCGIRTLLVPENISIPTPVSAHPDVNFFYFTNEENVEMFVSDSFYKVLIKEESLKDCEFFNNRVNVIKVAGKYPKDVLLNAVTVGDYIICNEKAVSKGILERINKKVIHVNQGYTKCSIAIVTKDSLITDDIGIYNKTKNIFDVCLVKRGEILLNGYNYGFIGGSCGKISNYMLAFFGNLKYFSDADKIISFCKNYKVDCISLSNKPLYDYGSIIPLIE